MENNEIQEINTISNSQKEKEIIMLIQRQTNYSEKDAREKLKKFNNNYLHVIRDYMNPNFNKKKDNIKKKNIKPTNKIRNKYIL